MYTVQLHHWVAGSGYTHSEAFDRIEEITSAEEYYNAVDGLESFTGNVEILDEDGNVVSEYFVEGD